MKNENADFSFDSLLDQTMDSWRARAGFTFLRAENVNCERHGGFICRVYQNSAGELSEKICPTCVSEKAEAERKAEEAALHAELQAARISNQFDQACVPVRFKNRTLDNYEITEGENQARVHAYCKKYVENFNQVLENGTSIIFSGGVGTGKTHLSVGIANGLIAKGHTALFATVSGCVRRVRASWRSETETESDALKIFLIPQLLILDEVGIQSGSDNEHQILFEIINARYSNCLPTILLTNLPILDQVKNGVLERKGLKSFIGERLLDRMREGGGKAFTCDWQSGRTGR